MSPSRRDAIPVVCLGVAFGALLGIAVARATHISTQAPQIDVVAQLENGRYESVATPDPLYKTTDDIRIHLAVLRNGDTIIAALSADLPVGTPHGIRRLLCEPVDPVNVSESVKDFQNLREMVLKGSAPVTVQIGSEKVLTIQSKGRICMGETQ
jgi:hypothetical protein